MKIVSRYVLRQFVGSLVLSLSAFATIFVVIDMVDRLSAFIDREVALETMALFYLYYLPYILVLVMPMAVLLAGLFCMGNLIRNGELLAMKASGISLYQVVMPLQVCALCVSIMAVWLADRVAPEANYRRAEIEHPRNSELGPRMVRSQVILRDVGGRIFSMREYDPVEKKGRDVMLDRYENRLVERIRASEVAWEEDRWVFFNGDRRALLDREEIAIAFDAWAAPGIALTPADFAREYRPEEQMTFSELRAFIARKEQSGGQALREWVALHLRLSFPFANFVIGLFGLPLASRMRKTGRPLQVGVCLLACFAFYGCIQVGRAMGWNGVIPPVWGAWGANVLFALIGVVLLVRTRK